MLTGERRRTSGRLSVERERDKERQREGERAARHFMRPWSQMLFASKRRKGWGVRTERVRASFVTMRRDVSDETSGRKQLDDLSTAWPGYGEWFYRHLPLPGKSNQDADGTNAWNREPWSYHINNYNVWFFHGTRMRANNSRKFSRIESLARRIAAVVIMERFHDLQVLNAVNWMLNSLRGHRPSDRKQTVLRDHKSHRHWGRGNALNINRRGK